MFFWFCAEQLFRFLDIRQQQMLIDIFPVSAGLYVECHTDTPKATANTRANVVLLLSYLFSLVFLCHKIEGKLLDLHDVIRFPRLVEELDVGSVKADDRHEVPTFNGLDPVGVGHALGLRRAKEDVD